MQDKVKNGSIITYKHKEENQTMLRQNYVALEGRQSFNCRLVECYNTMCIHDDQPGLIASLNAKIAMVSGILHIRFNLNLRKENQGYERTGNVCLTRSVILNTEVSRIS